MPSFASQNRKSNKLIRIFFTRASPQAVFHESSEILPAREGENGEERGEVLGSLCGMIQERNATCCGGVDNTSPPQILEISFRQADASGVKRYEKKTSLAGLGSLHPLGELGDEKAQHHLGDGLPGRQTGRQAHILP